MKPHLLHVFSTFSAAGPQVRTVGILNALAEQYRHTILSLDEDTGAAELIAPEVEAKILPPAPPPGTLRMTWNLRRALKNVEPDGLLTYNWGAIEALFAARTLGFRRVLHHEDGFLPDEVGALKGRRNWTRRWAFRGVEAVIVPSHVLEEIAREHWRVPPARLSWIPNGIRVEDFPARDGNASLRSELGVPPDAVIVGYVGHLRAEKNPVRLIRAVAAMREPNVHVLMLGDGPERPAVEAAVRQNELGDRVHLMGHRETPQPYYGAMDLFALSSDTEQMPVAQLEAMASALPIVATDVGDVKSMLPGDQARFVVPLVEPERSTELALSEALDGIARDGDQRDSLGRANRIRVEEQYSFELMLAAYRRLYAGLASCGR